MKWISVKDKLPETDRAVFMASKYWVGVGRFINDEEFGLLLRDDCGAWMDKDIITHWTELPSNPNNNTIIGEGDE